MKLFLIMTLVLGMIYLLGMLKVKSDENWMGKECTAGLKGLAVLMVVWGHIGACLHVKGIQFIGGAGVSIFLILSGYGLEKSYTNNGLKKFWIKKLIKVFIPFWIIELIGSLVTCDFDIKNYILDVLLLKPGTAYGWYMGYLFICYCLFYIYKTLIEKKVVKDGGGVLLFVAWFVIDSLLFANPDMPFLRARQMLCFPVGVLLAKKSNIDSLNIGRKVIVALGVIGIGFMALTQLEFVKSMPYIISNLLSLFTVMPLAGNVICISKLCPLITQSRISQLMGKYSFEIYLIHAFTLSVVSNDVLGILKFWVLTLCCAILLNRIVSKWRI